MDLFLAQTLARWVCTRPENRTLIEEWLDTAILSIAEGNGNEVMSTSTNGVSVSFKTNGLTNNDWANVLSYALTLIDRPRVTKLVGIIR